MTIRFLASRIFARVLSARRGPGYIDTFDINRIAGWATDPEDPGSPALLSLHIDGTPAMNIVADLARDDVQAAGLAPRHCGFDATLPRRLRDGSAHVVELRLGVAGPVLRGGRLKIPADPARAATSAEEAAPAGIDTPTGDPEGVAFYNPRTAAIEGWAIGCASVWVQLPGQATLHVTLNREVPGFGSGSRQGFAVKLPLALMDGADHAVSVTFEAGGPHLDGSPIHFATRSDSPRATVTRRNGPHVEIELRDVNGHLLPDPIVVLADGNPLRVRSSAETRTGCHEVTLPEAVSHLHVEAADGEVLARFQVHAGQLLEPAVPNLPAEALSPEICARARAAFETFCAGPDDRFDPLWYRWARPDVTDGDDLVSHYRAHAPDGASPNPFFNEIAARRLNPGVAAAITAGDIPCAFALELALEPTEQARGRSALNMLSHLPPNVARALSRGGAERAALMRAPDDEPAYSSPFFPAGAAQAQPLPMRMPTPTSIRPPSDGIYAAWVSRLVLNAKQRAQLEQDEREMRHDIAGLALTRAPLVSIIMPSWNRAFTIGEAIQSVLDQTYDNWELIVSDDASEDRTSEVVRRFDDRRIRYMKFLKSNGAGARNKGLRHARGEYIAYLDSDNIWHPQFLDMMMRRLLANPGHAIAYSAYLDTEIDGAEVRLNDISRPPFRPIPLSSKNFMDLNTLVHHRRLYDWLGGFDGSLPRLQDWDLVLRYTGIFRPLFVNRIGVFYRRNSAWGQVTHLHMGSDAQNTVNMKTLAKLETGHERLSIPWPGRGHVTILCGHPPKPAKNGAHRLMAESLANLVSDAADVDLFYLGAAPDSPASTGGPSPTDHPSRITVHHIPLTLAKDPVQLGQALGPQLLGRTVLTIGMSASQLRAIPTLDPRETYRLRASADGCVLQGVNTPWTRFDIGSLSLDLPAAESADQSATPILLVIPPEKPGPGYMKELEVESRRRGLRLLLPPRGTAGWQMIDSAQSFEMAIGEGGLPANLGICALTVCLKPVAELDVFELALVNALQGRGVPAAVLPDKKATRATGLARQWTEARAAYDIQVNSPKWICDKLRKLLNDPGSMQMLSERSVTVHRIALASDLARERLAHALYRMLFDTPEREVLDGHR